MDRFPAWSRVKRPASSYAGDSSWSSRDGGSKTPCADARAGCCSPTWRSTATGPSAATSSPRRCGAGKGAPPAYESLLAPPLSRLRKALGPGVLEGRRELQLILPTTPGSTGRSRRASCAAPARAERPAGGLGRRQGGARDRRRRPAARPRGAVDRRAPRRARRPARRGARDAGRGRRPARRRRACPRPSRPPAPPSRPQPFRESARAALMEVLRARGNVNEALRVYEDIRVLLREELGSSPGAALVALHEQLLRDDPRRRRRPPRAPRRPQGRRPRWSSATARSRCSTRCSQEAVEGEGRAVLIEGPPGIGKSRLLAEFRRRAIADGALVLNARAGELEREFPFGVVRQLFEARRRPTRTRSPAPPRRARVVFAVARRRPADRRRRLLRRPARPLLAGAQPRGRAARCCSRSTTCTGATARRCASSPTSCGASRASRCSSPRPCAPATRRPTPRCWPRSPTTRRPPTSARARCREEAVGALVARRLGAEPDRAFREACHTHHGRQPAARPPAAERAGDRRGQARRRPRRRRARDRLARGLELASCCGSRACPARPPTVARAVAVLGEGADLPAVAGVAGLDEAQVAGTMAALARAEILRPEPPPGFVHPLVRDAVYQGLPLGERELLHARAAGVLRADRRRAGPDRRPAHAHAAARRRRGRAAAARGGHRGVRARRDRQRRRLPAARARGAARRRDAARGCCSTSARSRRSRAAPRRPSTCARPTTA